MSDRGAKTGRREHALRTSQSASTASWKTNGALRLSRRKRSHGGDRARRDHRGGRLRRSRALADERAVNPDHDARNALAQAGDGRRSSAEMLHPGRGQPADLLALPRSSRRRESTKSDPASRRGERVTRFGECSTSSSFLAAIPAAERERRPASAHRRLPWPGVDDGPPAVQLALARRAERRRADLVLGDGSGEPAFELFDSASTSMRRRRPRSEVVHLGRVRGRHRCRKECRP